MRVLVTGGNGFIGRAVVRRLAGRGDSVIAIVRDPGQAPMLAALGVDLQRGDLSRTPAVVEAMRGCDAAIHLAGQYRVGIAAAERPAMHDRNVGTTLRVLDAAAVSGLSRLVAISTVNTFGDTGGRIVDEHHRRDIGQGFLSWYDETKFLAHRAVEERMAAGAAIVMAMPGAVYGQGDHSGIGGQLRAAHDGTLRYVAMADTGISAAHVDDVASGVVAALDRGRVGESYILGGENTRLIDAMRIAARLGGRTLARFVIPPPLLRMVARTPAPIAVRAGLPPDLAEVVRAGLGVTYWASSAKAATELGYVPRDLSAGLRAAFGDD